MILRIISALLIIIIPWIVINYVHRRFDIAPALLSVGLITFIGAFAVQTVLLAAISTSVTVVDIINAVMVGIIVGFTDVIARFLGYQYLAKSTLYKPQTAMIGAGHGLLLPIVIGGGILLDMISRVSNDNTDFNLTVSDHFSETIVSLGPFFISILISWLVLQTFLRTELKWLVFAIAWQAIVVGTEAFIVGGADEPQLFVTIWWIISIGISSVWYWQLNSPEQFAWRTRQKSG